MEDRKFCILYLAEVSVAGFQINFPVGAEHVLTTLLLSAGARSTGRVEFNFLFNLFARGLERNIIAVARIY